MTKKKKNDKVVKRTQRHPLLLYQHLNEQNFWVSLLIVATMAGLLIWNPPQEAGYRPYFFVVLVGSAAVLILTFLYRLTAYVQCREDELIVQLPFFRLTAPYDAIRTTRPNEFIRVFLPQEQRWTQRYFLRWLWKATVVEVDLEKLPAPRPWLQLRMGKYLLDPHEDSLVLAVRDWIALRSELDEALSRHRRSVRKP
jgi:hypothetical protein